jgi:hypothetical protein
MAVDAKYRQESGTWAAARARRRRVAWLVILIGQPALRHYSLMGYILDPTVLVEETAPAIADRIRADNVDAVALVPA